MNISKVLSALKRARKYKVLLPYHVWENGGIDVPPEDYSSVEHFLACFLKALKPHRVNASVSRYGHLAVFCPPFDEPVSINIRREWPQSVFAKLASREGGNNRYAIDLDKPLTLQFQVMRQRTKSHTFLLENIETNALPLAKTLVEKIILQTHKYPSPAVRRHRSYTYCLGIEDIMAVSRYGQAKFKTNTAYAGINRFVIKHYTPESVKICERVMTLTTNFYFQNAIQTIYLSNRDKALLKKFLPDLPIGAHISHQIFKMGRND